MTFIPVSPNYRMTLVVSTSPKGLSGRLIPGLKAVMWGPAIERQTGRATLLKPRLTSVSDVIGSEHLLSFRGWCVPSGTAASRRPNFGFCIPTRNRTWPGLSHRSISMSGNSFNNRWGRLGQDTKEAEENLVILGSRLDFGIEARFLDRG